ncbi:MAG: HMA2 domain-containing protein, partial [Polyangiaceae bacterium]
MPSEHPFRGPGEEKREPLELVHHHPGRVRLRAISLVGETDVAERIRHALEGQQGIRRCVHNTRTGSLLIEYEPALADAESIIQAVTRASGLGEPLSPREARARRRSPARLTADVARELDALTYELTGWRTDLRFLAPVGLAAAAAFSFARNKPDGRLPRWDTLLWWSYNVFSSLN